jgi:hypothetical protein
MINTLLIPILVTLSVATFALRLRPPRPSLRRLFHQSGTSACGIAVACLCYALAWWLVCVFKGTPNAPPEPEHLLGTISFLSRYTIGPAVAGAWLVMFAMGRRWNSGSDWLERAGCALGVAWILNNLINISGSLQVIPAW